MGGQAICAIQRAYLTALGYDLVAAGALFSTVIAIAIPCRILWGRIGSFYVASRYVMSSLAFGMAVSVVFTGAYKEMACSRDRCGSGISSPLRCLGMAFCYRSPHASHPSAGLDRSLVVCCRSARWARSCVHRFLSPAARDWQLRRPDGQLCHSGGTCSGGLFPRRSSHSVGCERAMQGAFARTLAPFGVRVLFSSRCSRHGGHGKLSSPACRQFAPHWPATSADSNVPCLPPHRRCRSRSGRRARYWQRFAQ